MYLAFNKLNVVGALNNTTFLSGIIQNFPFPDSLPYIEGGNGNNSTQGEATVDLWAKFSDE